MLGSLCRVTPAEARGAGVGNSVSGYALLRVGLGRDDRPSSTNMRTYTFDKARLISLAEAHRGAFENAQPFRHVVIDDFLPGLMAERALEEFPRPDSMEEFTRQHYENKIALRPDNPTCPEAIEV